MFDKLTQVFDELLKTEDLFKKVSAVYWKFSRELVKQGFTEEQAMEIMLKNPIVGGSIPQQTNSSSANNLKAVQKRRATSSRTTSTAPKTVETNLDGNE